MLTLFVKRCYKAIGEENQNKGKRLFYWRYLKMINKGFGSQSGKSLIELLVVLVVAAVLVTLAVAQFGKTEKTFQRQNLAREFKVNLERARFDSVKRRANGTVGNLSRVIITSATSFTAITDLNQNGTLEANESRVVNFGAQSGIRFVGDLIYPITMSFDRHGHIAATNGVMIDGSPQAIVPNFTICDKECTVETANAANANIISISPSGTVAMLKGGEAVPTFASPTVAAAADAELMNPWLRTSSENDNGTVEPTPAATATPTTTASPQSTATPTPTVSPTTSPTATATATPTPTQQATPVPSPTQPACANGDRPSPSGCRCYAPMTVQGNKCRY